MVAVLVCSRELPRQSAVFLASGVALECEAPMAAFSLPSVLSPARWPGGRVELPLVLCSRALGAVSRVGKAADVLKSAANRWPYFRPAVPYC